MMINYWAVLASAVASMIIGGLWYGPIFGKLFMRAQGWDKLSKGERKAMMTGMVWSYICQFIVSVVMFFALSFLISDMGVIGAVGGMELALLIWLGFIVTTKFGDALWGGKSILFWLNIGDMLVTLVVAGAIIGAWR